MSKKWTPISQTAEVLTEKYTLENRTTDFGLLRISISPQARMAAESHQVSELWTVVLGNVVAIIGEDRISLTPGDTVEIPPYSSHSLVNDTSELVVVMSVFWDSRGHDKDN